MLWVALTLFLIVDVIVVSFVLRRVLKNRVATGGVDILAAAKFARAAHEEVGEYLRANYGGDTDALPRVMQGLVDQLDARARSEGLTLDRATLKQLAGQSVTAHRVAKPNDVRIALERVV